MAFQSWQGNPLDYGNGVSLSSKELARARLAAESYDWLEDKGAAYPQIIRCKKSGQMATKRAIDDVVLWDKNNRNILMLNINEYSIQDVIV